MNLAIFGTIFLLVHFGVDAERCSTCSFPGLPGRDGLPGQPGRDGRDGSSGPVGPPGGKLKTLCKSTLRKAAACRIIAYTKHYQPLQCLELKDQMALPDHLVNKALLDPLVLQELKAPQEEQITFVGGGQCAQMLLEQSLFTVASLLAVTIHTLVGEPTTSAQ